MSDFAITESRIRLVRDLQLKSAALQVSISHWPALQLKTSLVQIQVVFVGAQPLAAKAGGRQICYWQISVTISTYEHKMGHTPH